MGKRIGSRSLGIHIDPKLDCKIIDEDIASAVENFDRIQVLGHKLISDIDKVDHLIGVIEQSPCSDSDKCVRIQALENTRTELIEQYQRNVEDVKEEVREEILEGIECLDEGFVETRRQAQEIRCTNFDAGNRESLDDAADIADKQADEYDRIKVERSAELQQRIDQMNAMRRQMMRDSMSRKS